MMSPDFETISTTNTFVHIRANFIAFKKKVPN